MQEYHHYTNLTIGQQHDTQDLKEIVNILSRQYVFFIPCASGAFGKVFLAIDGDLVQFVKIQKFKSSKMPPSILNLIPVKTLHMNDCIVSFFDRKWVSKITAHTIITETLDDLRVLHSKGLQHCDVHPGNISIFGGLIDNDLVSAPGTPFEICNTKLHDNSDIVHDKYDYNCLTKWVKTYRKHLIFDSDFIIKVRNHQKKLTNSIRDSYNTLFKICDGKVNTAYLHDHVSFDDGTYEDNKLIRSLRSLKRVMDMSRMPTSSNEQDPDVIVTDENLQTINGYDLFSNMFKRSIFSHSVGYDLMTNWRITDTDLRILPSGIYNKEGGLLYPADFKHLFWFKESKEPYNKANESKHQIFLYINDPNKV